MKKIKVNIKRKKDAKDLPIPGYATTGSSGVEALIKVKRESLIWNDTNEVVASDTVPLIQTLGAAEM